MISPFATLLPAAELSGKALFAGPVPARGRDVPPDRIAEPEFRPVYPRYVKPFAAVVAELPEVKLPPAGYERAQAARYRARVAVKACERREAL